MGCFYLLVLLLDIEKVDYDAKDNELIWKDITSYPCRFSYAFQHPLECANRFNYRLTRRLAYRRAKRHVGKVICTLPNGRKVKVRAVRMENFEYYTS
jgi:hypothetical protein